MTTPTYTPVSAALSRLAPANACATKRAADGKPGVVCYYFDAIRLQQAHQTVRENEERFRNFTSAIANVVYRISPDWREMRLLDGKEFIANTKETSQTWIEKYIHPVDQKDVTAAIEHATRSKTIFEMEHRVIRADGSLGWTHSL